jgi:Flp pilus assembly pilin Flp
MLIFKERQVRIMNRIKEFFTDESGMGVVEVLLIIVVLVAMVVIFQEKIESLVKSIWKSINKDAKKIYS